MSADVPATPPQAVRAVTHEDLARDIDILKTHDGEAFTALRRIEARLDFIDARAEARHGAVIQLIVKPRLRFSFWGLFR